MEICSLMREREGKERRKQRLVLEREGLTPLRSTEYGLGMAVNRSRL
jgi:hypothetical protein